MPVNEILSLKATYLIYAGLSAIFRLFNSGTEEKTFYQSIQLSLCSVPQNATYDRKTRSLGHLFGQISHGKAYITVSCRSC